MRFLKALRREPVDRTPMWFMRQAGRYLPEYRDLRSKAKNFLDFCKTPSMAIEATLQPLRRYPHLDASIIFSDILVIPEAMGLSLDFIEGRGPVFNETIRNEESLSSLSSLELSNKLSYVYEAISGLKKEINVPLIGFTGSPWTLAVYMIDGHGKTNFPLAQKMLYENEELLISLLDKLVFAVAEHLIEQVKSGADVIMMFDTWGGILPAHIYQKISLPYMKKVIEQVKKSCSNTPVIMFSKGCSASLEEQVLSGCDAIGIDQFTDLKKARQVVGNRVALQGNLNPSSLYAPADRLEKEVKLVLDAFAGEPGHIFNLGHGIMPDVNPQALSIVCESVVSYSKEMMCLT